MKRSPTPNLDLFVEGETIIGAARTRRKSTPELAPATPGGQREAIRRVLKKSPTLPLAGLDGFFGWNEGTAKIRLAEMVAEGELVDDPRVASLKRVMAGYEEHRAEILAELRDHARGLAAQHGSVSVNDIRPYYESLGYDGDPRILGAVFRKSDGWHPVGTEPVDAPNSHPGHTVTRWSFALDVR